MCARGKIPGREREREKRREIGYGRKNKVFYKGFR